MERVNSESRPARNDRKGRWHLVLPPLALLFQLVPPSLLWALADSAYVSPPRLPETWVHPASLLILGFSAGISLLLGSLGVYGLLTRARPGIALLMIVLCCLPALLGGALYLHALLVFLTWI